MRSPSQTNTWEYWIPGWSQILAARDIISGNASQGISKTFGVNDGSQSTAELANQAMSILGDSRSQYLEDRAHTEAREDSSLDRLVEAYNRNGLNSAMIAGATSGLGSSASTVNSDIISNKLQVLGYILDLKNLDAKNRKITNDAISDVLGIFKKK